MDACEWTFALVAGWGTMALPFSRWLPFPAHTTAMCGHSRTWLVHTQSHPELCKASKSSFSPHKVTQTTKTSVPTRSVSRAAARSRTPQLGFCCSWMSNLFFFPPLPPWKTRTQVAEHGLRSIIKTVSLKILLYSQIGGKAALVRLECKQTNIPTVSNIFYIVEVQSAKKLKA